MLFLKLVHLESQVNHRNHSFAVSGEVGQTITLKSPGGTLLNPLLGVTLNTLILDAVHKTKSFVYKVGTAYMKIV